MLELLAKRYKSHSGVMGIEVFNEPVVSHIPRRGEDLLASFYQRACDRIHGSGFDKSVWIQPSAIHLFSQQYRRPRNLRCEHLVYAPHFYPNFLRFHGGTIIETWETFVRKSMGALAQEAADLNAPLVIGELGIDPHQTGYAEFAEALYRVSAELRVAGHAKWLWKEKSQGSWGFFDWDRIAAQWVFRDHFAEAVMKPMLLGTSGRVESLQYGQLGIEISLNPRAASEFVSFFHQASQQVETRVDGVESPSEATSSPNIRRLQLSGLTPGKVVKIEIRPRR